MEPVGTALVTGASRGIGRAVALELRRRGFDVLATMRDPAQGVDLEGPGLRVARLDVTLPDSIDIPESLDVLVNNAGIEGDHLPVEHAPMELWRSLFETNLFGLVEVTRRALPALRRARGVLCNVTSCSILLPVPFFAAYRASKAAVSALGESLRAELAPTGVRVLEVQPGAIRTDMLTGSERAPEAASFPAYRGVAEKFQAMRQASRDDFEDVEKAARSMVDAIADPRATLRHGPDPMSEALLAAWRSSDDETLMGGMLLALSDEESGSA